MRIQVIQPLKGYTPQVGTWLWAFENSRQRILQLIEGINPGLLGWVPTWGGNTISTLLYHFAAIEVNWLFTDILENEEFTPEISVLFPQKVRQPTGDLTVIEEVSLENHLQRLSALRKYFLGSLREMSDDDFQRVRSYPDYNVNPRWTIHHLMQHEAEHRGEIMSIRDAYRNFNEVG